MGNATSIFNLMRNIGASIGISMVETMQVRRAQMHVNILGEYVNSGNPDARHTVDGLRALFMSQGKDSATATRQAYGCGLGNGTTAGRDALVQRRFRFLAMMFVAHCCR